MDRNKVIERIKAGNDEDLKEIYSKYRKEFLAWVTRSYNCSEDDGKDIYQATVIAFFEGIVSGKLRELTSSVKTYLFAIGKNKLQEFKRSAKKENITEVMDDNEYFYTPGYSDSQEESLQLVEKALDELGDPCRTILHLYYYQKLSLTLITEKLNYKNTDTSKNLKYKCLRRLRKIYENKIENSK
jgi:RNA polymerase sigma factor (sigma-70 family)